jgi:class 3 adenylate cyclase
LREARWPAAAAAPARSRRRCSPRRSHSGSARRAARGRRRAQNDGLVQRRPRVHDDFRVLQARSAGSDTADESFSDSADAIIERNGTIDKYIGDAIMAFWNAPLDDPQQEINACEAALEMLARADKLNQQFKHEADQNGGAYRPPHVGIGLNTGPCVVGNMGSDFRFNYSVLGDTVNVASRLEGRTKDYRIPIVIGAGTEQNAREKFATLEIDRIQVKGKTEPGNGVHAARARGPRPEPECSRIARPHRQNVGVLPRAGLDAGAGSHRALPQGCRTVSASARSSICTPNASRRSAVIRRRRIGTASTRPRANSLFKPAALARASQEQKR